MDYILLASFVDKTQIEGFMKVLVNDFNNKKKYIFIHEIEENENEYLVTYKILKTKRSEINKFFNGITTLNIHVKNRCIFSINALNKLIDTQIGNLMIARKDYKIDWGLYENTLMILNKQELMIKNITRIDDKL